MFRSAFDPVLTLLKLNSLKAMFDVYVSRASLNHLKLMFGCLLSLSLSLSLSLLYISFWLCLSIFRGSLYGVLYVCISVRFYRTLVIVSCSLCMVCLMAITYMYIVNGANSTCDSGTCQACKQAVKTLQIFAGLRCTHIQGMDVNEGSHPTVVA